MSVERSIDLSQWIEREQLGAFMGYKGNNIKSIEGIRKVLLFVEDTFCVKITGAPSAVDLAIIDVEIHALSILWRSARHSFCIPSELIGRNGQKINGIKNDSSAAISIHRESENVLTRVAVSVSGQFPVILSATGMIKDRLDSFGQDFTPYNRADRKEFFETWDEVVYDD